MPTLSVAQRNSLQQKIDTGDIIGFYNDLSNYGDPYGRLGGGVTNNNTWQGEMANNFAKEGGKNNGVNNLDYGTPGWLDLNKACAQGYLNAYNTNNGGTPTWDQVQDFHNTEYQLRGLDADDWLPNKLLNDSSNPNDLWADYMNNTGPADLWGDALDVVNAAGRPIMLPGVGTVFAPGPDEIKFAKNFLNALADLDPAARGAMAGDFNPIAPLLGFLDQLGKSFQWGWDHPHDPLPWLPSWLQGPLAPLLGAPATVPSFGGGGYGDPLTLDLDRDGFDLVSLENSTVYFDYFGDGYAEHTGWVASDDGILVWDKNTDGKIVSGELIGTDKPLAFANDQGTTYTTDNGFAYLADYDLNNDGKINNQDTIYTQLQVWRDFNQNGVSEAGELFNLSALGIASINLTNITTYAVDHPSRWWQSRIIEGNPLTHAGTYTLTNGTTGEVGDVWYQANYQDSGYIGNYTTDIRTYYLPTLRGYGMLPDLHIAMSLDSGSGGLFDKVYDFVLSRTGTQWFTQAETVRADVSDILLTWAKVNLSERTIEADGVFSKMPEFYFIKAWTGTDQEYIGTWFQGNHFLPNPANGIMAIYQTWDNLLDAYTARLVFQSGGSSLFASGVSYNPYTDTFEGPFQLLQSAITNLQTAAASATDKEGFWHSVALFIDNTEGIANLTSSELGWLTSAVSASTGSALSWAGIIETLGVHHIVGTTAAETINGTRWDDNIHSGGGGGTINGGAGNDHLYGGENYNGDSDTLIGGAGNDILEGGTGNDIYIYESGHDVIVEFGGNFYPDTDIIQMASGINPGDVTLHLARMDTETIQLFLNIAGHGTITIQDDGAWWSPITSLVDEIHYANGAVSQIAAMDITLHGTSGNDSLGAGWGFTGSHTILGYGGDDNIWVNTNEISATIDGGSGNDTISVAGGNDTIIFSAGNDLVYDAGGDDVIKMPTGITASNVHFYRGTNEFYNDAFIVVDGVGTLRIQNQFSWVNNANISSYIKYGVEKLQYADGSTVNLTTQIYTVQGTSGDDYTTSTPWTWNQKNDIYLFGTGHDRVYEENGFDVVQFGAGITSANITILRSNDYTSYGDLKITDTAGNSLLIMRHFLDSTAQIEQLKFADGSTINLSSIEVETKGTEGNDSITGMDTGDASPNDTIYGYGGDDQIYGDAGNDTLIGGDGNNVLDGGAGNDTVSYAGSGETVTVTATAVGSYTVQHGGYTDYLYGIENIILSDGSSALANTTYNVSLTAPQTVGDPGGTDKIVLGGNFMPENLNYWSSGYDLIIAPIASPENALTITNHFLPGNVSAIETLQFADGFTLPLSRFSVWRSGTTGNDAMYGDQTAGAADVIFGGLGNDTIRGYNGGDVLSGDAGNDKLYGGGQNDILHGGSGADTLYGETGLDLLYGGTGDDIYSFKAGDSPMATPDIVSELTDAGADTIKITGGIVPADTQIWTYGGYLHIRFGTDEILVGGSVVSGLFFSNVETLTFDNGTTVSLTQNIPTIPPGQTYSGTAVANNFHGSIGNDTYLWGAGSGADTIVDDGGPADKILVSTSLLQENIAYTVNGNDLVISSIAVPGDKITITGAFVSGGQGGVESLQFADGFALPLSRFASWRFGTASGEAMYGDQTAGAHDVILGGAGNDTIRGYNGNDILLGEAGNDKLYGGNGTELLYGGSGNDTLYGEAGQDTMYGGMGDDLYSLKAGDSPQATPDVIFETAGEGNDTIKLTGGILPADAQLWTSGGYLHIRFGADEVLVSGSTASGSFVSNVENLTFDNGTIVSLTQNIPTSLPSQVYAGTSAADNFHGANGDDTYLWGTGSGADTILDDGGLDKIIVNANILAENLLYSVNGNNLIITSALSAADSLSISNEMVLGSLNLIETLEFADGFALSLSKFNSWVNGTTANDVMYGDQTAGAPDIIFGGAGNDTIKSYNGSDIIVGEAGNDKLYGGLGNDMLYGGSGNDTLLGEGGVDTLWGGSGINILTGGSEADKFMFDASSLTAGTSNTVTDFLASEGDKLDLSAVLETFDPLTQAITDYVQMTTSGSDTLVKVDLDGTGTTQTWQQIATLTGVTGLTDEAALVSSGNLIVA